MFVSLLGDKLFLVIIGAKEIEEKNTDLYKMVENLSCLNQIEAVRIYKSFLIPVNILCIQPLFSSPSLICSNKILEEGDSDILYKTLKVSLPLIKKGALRQSTFISLLVSVVFLPTYLFEKLGFKKIALLYSYFFSPIGFLKDYIVLGLNNQLGPLDKIELEQISFFLERYQRQSHGFVEHLSADLSLLNNSRNGLWEKLTQSSEKLKLKKAVLNERES